MTEMIIDGAAFEVRVEGEEGAPVLMLAHSLGTNLHLFDRLMPEFLRRFRVVRYDARGQGASVISPGPYSIAQLGQDALAILDALRLEKVDWLGVSQGGCVGLWLLTHAPERIGRAVLANVAAQIGAPDMWNERIKTVQEKGIGSLAPAVLENWFTKSFREHHSEEVEHYWETLLAAPAEGYAGICAALRDMDLREAIRTITNPVLVIAGRHDPITPPGVGALVASAISGAKLVTLETAHLSCVEDPAGFSHAALEFLTAEERTMAEEAPQEMIEEAPTQMPPPVKKPRKPRAPRKPMASVDAEAEIAPTLGAMSQVEPEAEPKSERESASVPESEPSMPVPLAPRRKPRQRRPAAVAPAPAAPAIAVTAPQRRKRPVKRAAAKKAAVRQAPMKKAPVKKVAAKKASARKAVARKAVAKKAPVKKAAMRKVGAAAPARRAVAKKIVAKKTGAKKTVARKTVARKTVARKAVAKRVVAKRAVAKKMTGKKMVAKKAVVKKAPMRKIAAKKVLVRKAVVKKTQAKKAGVKKATTKKAVSRKALPRRMPGRPATARKR